MAKLAQIIAIEKQTKSQVERDLSDAYHLIQKNAASVVGMARTFRHAAELKEGEKRDTPPDVNTPVQVRSEDVVKKTGTILTKLLDITATKDSANCSAKADVKLDDATFLAAVPVTTLIFLEKKLIDVRTMISKMPVLDTAETWHYDQARGVHASEPVDTHSTKKVKKVIQVAKATDKHPEQAQVYDDDEVVGYWKTTKFSGALPKDRQDTILERIDTLLKAIKFAREEANSGPAPEVKMGEKVFAFLFAK